ncbi:MAG: hypothetical protein EOM88_04610 [Clostridia bacterium]|nr:hypothetical protein [Clostridia bacterium]
MFNPNQLIDRLYGPPKTTADKKLEDFKLKNIPKPEKPQNMVENEFENINFSEQYDRQLDLLKQTKLIEQLPSGEYGIIGIDQKEYIIPTLDEILQRMNNNIEKFETKIEQGFTKLLIVPFAKKLHDPEDSKSLTEIYKQTIIDKYNNDQLMATSGDKLDLDTNKPLWVWKDGYSQPEENIIYFPKQYDKDNHGGKTKSQLLRDDNLGFQVLLIEDLPDLPAPGSGQTISDRTQLEAGLTPAQYLEKLTTDPNYQNEQGLTAEAWLTYAITHLQETNQVIDDWQGQGKYCYNLATYFPFSSPVSGGYWSRGNRRAFLGGDDVSSSDSGNSVRPSVNI